MYPALRLIVGCCWARHPCDLLGQGHQFTMAIRPRDNLVPVVSYSVSTEAREVRSCFWKGDVLSAVVAEPCSKLIKVLCCTSPGAA